MKPDSFEEVVYRIYDADNRFDPDAYFYLRDVIDRTTQALGRSGPKAEDHHVTGAELSKGFCDCMLEDFGPMASTLADEWGLVQSDDIGSMVYNLIQAGAFGKSPNDRKEDFNDLFFLPDVLEKPYIPTDIQLFKNILHQRLKSQSAKLKGQAAKDSSPETRKRKPRAPKTKP